jgi:hypothetical protein
LLALVGVASADRFPPPKIDDLLKAKSAAIGRFEIRKGALSFKSERLLWGKGIDCADVELDEDGKLFSHVWDDQSTFWNSEGDRALWFSFAKDDFHRFAVQPPELVEGYIALRSGKTPTLLFRLLQQLDVDLRRAALETLFADRDAKIIDALHRMALDKESLAAHSATDVLGRTRLLDVNRFWGRWTGLSTSSWVQDLLEASDSVRAARELREAVAAEKRPAELDHLLYLAHADIELNLRYLAHAEDEVRGRALGNIWGAFWQLGREPDKAAARKELAERLLPLLMARRKVETAERVRRTLDKMLAEVDGVAWIFRVPSPVEQPPQYSEANERKFVLDQLTSQGRHGFVMESAGTELRTYFFEEGFAQLRKAAASSKYNRSMVFDGLGYVSHPRVFAFLVEQLKRAPSDATLRAIGRQNHERSLAVLTEQIDGRVPRRGNSARRVACDALALIRDERALALLKAREEELRPGGELAYWRARAVHGDAQATKELLLLLKKFGATDDLIGALLLSDAAEATEALRSHVRDQWPHRWETDDDSIELAWCMEMQNYAGRSRRTTALGELARRDPRWLAQLALRRMASASLASRICGAYIFRGLTARDFGYRAQAFAAEREEPLAKLRRWWAKHRIEPREEWLLSYFAEKGFAMKQLQEMASLPVLRRALSSDEFTHGLAIEQISVITGKFFANYAQPVLHYDEGASISTGGGGYESMSREQAVARVCGWLDAR